MNKINVYVVDYKRKFLVLQWTDPTTGKRKSQSSKCKTRREAERKASELEKKLNSLTPNGDGLTPWGDFVEFYAAEHLASLEQTSHDRAASGLNVFTELMDPAVIRSVTGAILSSYATKLRNLGRSEQTIATHFGIIRTALRWAIANGYSSEMPHIPKVTRARGTRAKGRPLTFWEVVKLLRAVPAVVGKDAAPSWQYFIKGLFVSGMRLDEALELTWQKAGTFESNIWIDTSGQFPLLGISADTEKGKQDRLLPLTPDFADFLLRTPKDGRAGYVFPLVKKRHRDDRNMDYTSKVISAIGKEAGVVVNSSGKFASAHDLRRSFGLRWAHRSYPAELQQLMRHEDIETTMKFYALIEATSFAERLWKQHGRAKRGQNTTPDTTDNEKE